MEICDAIGDGESLTAAACLNSLGLITAGRGDYQEGADLCRKAMKILETHPDDGQESMAGVLGNLAGILHDQGIFAEADALYGRALEIIEAQLGSEDPGIAPMLNGLALLRQDQGNYAAAEELFERSLRLRESVAGADDPAVALGLNNLAVIKKIRGDFAAAELLYRRAVKILESVFGPEHLLTAYGMNNLAAYYDAVGRAPEAEPLYQRALDIREAVMGAEHPLTLYTMSSLAAVHAARGKSDTASVLFRRSLSGLEKSLGPNHPHVINCLDGLAALMAESGSSEVLGMFDRSRQGAFRHARQSLGSLTESEQRLFLKNRFQPSFHAALLYTLQNRGSAADVSVSAAWVANCKGLVQEVLADRSLRLRDSSDAKAGPLLRDLETVERQLARLAMESPSATDFVRQGERVLELSQRANRLSKELALIAGTARESTAWVTTNELQGGIPAGAALIDIARVESTPMSGERADKGQSSPRYAAWITQSEAAGEPVLVDLGDAAEIESILAAIRKSIQSDGAVDGRIRQEGEPAAMQQLNVAMVQLSERIWAPIAPHLEDVSSILLSPDGQLWLAPWAALPVGDSQDPLIRRYSIRFLIRGSDLLAKRKTGANSGNPVIFADPNFNSSESEKRAAIEEVLREVPEVEAEAYGDTLRGYSSTGLLPLVLPLPNTALEAQLIAPKIEKMVSVKPAVYQTKFALESVAKSLKRPGMAIFATHGFFLPAPGTNDTESPVGASSDRSEGNAMAGGGSVLENPLLRCGLLLAGCNQRAVKVGDDDGVLTGLEITAIDFRGTDMVVLSACETGVGDVRIGEGVAGLRQAFQLAGARTVVATLWQIPDRDSAIIMNDFFENVARGETASEAMRQAQLKRIDARTNRYGAAHPLFWAAWTVTE
jgi:CHAT domain-containing protein